LLRPGGGTALLDAVKLISPAFQRARHQRKVLLLITDGNDTSLPAADVIPPYLQTGGRGIEASATLSRAQQTQRQQIIDGTKVDVRRSGALLYAIGIGTRKGAPVDTVLLENLTTESGGYVEPLRDPSEISPAVTRICYQAIRVRTRDTSLRVRARAGYVAPSATTR
jgi:Mg-chelatase subunit ChlD